MESILTKEQLIGLITKYAIILIVFDVVSRFGLSFGLQYFYDLFPPENPSRLRLTVVTSLASILVNLVFALIILADTDKKDRLTWTIFALTLFSPWTATIFFIITRVIEIKSNNRTSDN